MGFVCVTFLYSLLGCSTEWSRGAYAGSTQLHAEPDREHPAEAVETLRSIGVIDVDLVAVDLRNEQLGGAVFVGRDLRRVNLSGADLSDSDLRGADLSGADLHGADLRYTDLSNAHLERADLTGVNLSHANLTGAVLERTVMTGAKIHFVDLTGVDLRLVELTDVEWRHTTCPDGVKTGATGSCEAHLQLN